MVVRETGLSAHVLRVWEKRYGAVVPQRTATHRRVYSDADIHRLKLLRQATLLGHPIGSVASLSDQSLETLIKAAAGRAPILSTPPMEDGAPVADSPIILDCIEAVKATTPMHSTPFLNAQRSVRPHCSAAPRHLALAQRLGHLGGMAS